MRIVQRTPEQRVRIPEFVEKWTRIGLATGALDRERAESALCRIYQMTGRSEPQIAWLPCPLSAMLSALTYEAILITQPAGDRGVGDLVDRILGSALPVTAAPASAWAGFAGEVDYANVVLEVPL